MFNQTNTNAKQSRKTYTGTTEELRREIYEETFATVTPITKLAIKYRLSESTVHGIVERGRKYDTVEYKKRGGTRNINQRTRFQFLRDLIDGEKEGNILTLEQLRLKFMAKFPEEFPKDKSISITALHKHIDSHLMLTLKRSSPLEITQTTEQLKASRRQYAEDLSIKGISDAANCVFVDKRFFNACMVPGQARSKRGKKAHMVTKVKRSKNISIVVVMTVHRVKSLQYMMINRPTNRFILAEFMKQLIEWLGKEYQQPMFIIMDNARFHHSQEVQEIISRSKHTCHFLLPTLPCLIQSSYALLNSRTS